MVFELMSCTGMFTVLKLTNRMNSIENTLHSSTFKIKHTRETKGDAEADDED